MPRRARIDAVHAVRHIMVQGIELRDVFDMDNLPNLVFDNKYGYLTLNHCCDLPSRLMPMNPRAVNTSPFTQMIHL